MYEFLFILSLIVFFLVIPSKYDRAIRLKYWLAKMKRTNDDNN